MCRRVTCSDCGKPGWKGCGAHVEDVLGDVAPEDRCSCSEWSERPGRPGLLRRLLGG